MTARLLLCALLAGLPLGCATSNEPAAPEQRSAQAPSNPGASEARAVVLEGDVEPTTVEALAEHLQGLAEVHTVEISIQKTDDGPTIARLTLGGFDMPSTDELHAAIASFDGLNGDVSVSFEDDVAVPEGPVDAQALSGLDHEDETPEELEAKVIEKLRADGVEGDIHVDVIDEAGERRVEVRAEQQSAE